MNKTAEKEDVDDYFENNGTYHDEKYVLQVQVIKVTALGKPPQKINTPCPQKK